VQRLHQPRAGKLAMGFTVGVIYPDVIAGDVQPKKGEGGFGQGDRRHRVSSGGIVPETAKQGNVN
jgi:hypothetical protein